MIFARTVDISGRLSRISAGLPQPSCGLLTAKTLGKEEPRSDQVPMLQGTPPSLGTVEEKRRVCLHPSSLGTGGGIIQVPNCRSSLFPSTQEESRLSIGLRVGGDDHDDVRLGRRRPLAPRLLFFVYPMPTSYTSPRRRDISAVTWPQHRDN